MKRGTLRVIASAGVVVIGLMGSNAPAAQAWGNGWDWCSKVSMHVSQSSVRFSGDCDGGTLRLQGTFRKKSGSFSLKGYLGRDQVKLSGMVKNLTTFDGYIGSNRVNMSGSEAHGNCVIKGWIGDNYDNGHPTSMLGRMCSLMSYQR